MYRPHALRSDSHLAPVSAALFAAALLGLLSLASHAHAQEADDDEPAERPIAELPGAEDEARIHFRLATRYYRTGRFEEAARAYERAYALAPLPELLYNAYLGYREAGLLEDAVRMLSAFIPTVTDPVQRNAAEARLTSLRRLADRLESSGEVEPAGEPDPGDEASVGPDEPRPDDPLPQRPAPTSNDGDPLAVVAWSVAGVGVAALIASAITGGLALDRNAQLDAECGGRCPPSLAAVQEEGRTLSLATDVLWIGGAVLAGAGLVWGLVQLFEGGDSDSMNPGGVAWAR